MQNEKVKSEDTPVEQNYCKKYKMDPMETTAKIALDESHTWLLTVNHNQFNLEIATHVITFIN